MPSIAMLIGFVVMLACAQPEPRFYEGCMKKCQDRTGQGWPDPKIGSYCDSKCRLRPFDERCLRPDRKSRPDCRRLLRPGAVERLPCDIMVCRIRG